MKILKAGLFLSIFSLTIGCSNVEKNKEEKSNNESLITKEVLAEGFSLLENNCFSCHSPNSEKTNKVAPPIFAIKKHYLQAKLTREEFANSIANFVENPSLNKSKMPHAVEKFGLMPKMGFTNKQVKAVGYYLYQAKIEESNWYKSQYKNEQEKYNKILKGKKTSYVEKGLQYAMKTKSVLGKNLLGTIKNKGTVKALSFCNEKAYTLTDSMATLQNVHIKRVSDKNRNSTAVPNNLELAYINDAKIKLANGEKIKPQIQEIEGKMVGYYPIKTNKMCMQCHGDSKTDIKENTLLKIKELYPNDKATGYKPNQLRGIWVVEMDKE